MAKIAAAMLICFACLAVFAQQKAPRYVIGADMIGDKSPCLFIGGIYEKSPAADAGVQSGDRVIAINGTVVTTLQEAGRLMRSESPKPVALQLERNEKPFSVIVQRQLQTAIFNQNGMKALEIGMLAPLDATEAEMSHKIKLVEEHLDDRAFSSHYPTDPELYYPGFEIFVLKNPRQIAVGGIEKGPASRAGVHWGDIIVSVNGIDARNKSVAELEALFSSRKAAPMTLAIDRDGVAKAFTFQLEQASAVLRENQHQLIHDKLTPLGVPEQYQSCFE